MPTYIYECSGCDDQLEVWQSIHDDALSAHSCGGSLVKVIERVNTHGVGVHGAKTVEVDNREARWGIDLPAYKRFRDKGLQPPGIDGCDRLEATAKSELAIKTGGRINVPDHIARSSQALATEIAAGRQ